MPGFFDKVKSGAEKAAFEAERLRRLTQAQSTLKALQRDLELQVAEMGKQALALYDAGALTQPELLALCPQIDTQRQTIAAQEAEIERIRQEKPSTTPGTQEVKPAVAPAPVPESTPEVSPAEPQGPTCPNCHSPLPEDVKFCPECGTKVR